MAEIRLVHLSDLHLWRVPRNPLQVIGKRFFGLANLASNRWRKHRKPELQSVITQALSLRPDHAVIAGDITLTGLREEFADAARYLEPLLHLPGGATVIPGNHDRYGREVVKEALFEEYYGRYLGRELGPPMTYPRIRQHKPLGGFPCLNELPHGIKIFSMDISRPILWASSGKVQGEQEQIALDWAERLRTPKRNVLMLCHYPYRKPKGTLARGRHGVVNARDLEAIVVALNPPLYLHGHTHAPGSYLPAATPETWCLDAGSASANFMIGGPRASFIEILGREIGGIWHWTQRVWLLTRNGWITQGSLQEPQTIAIRMKEVKKGRVQSTSSSGLRRAVQV
ncbi:MAG TPA: metallophosphoesterase [Planctomycetota bacterium]|nr:metallophosphoesterase [Planctomycetota bacterium]